MFSVILYLIFEFHTFHLCALELYIIYYLVLKHSFMLKLELHNSILIN